MDRETHMKPAPIALFVYNRPSHIQKTLEALRANELADRSELFIFSDGPRNESDRENVEAVREQCRTIQGFKKIVMRESEGNRGLAASITAGVTEIVNAYGKIIVMEDDLVSSPHFLSYMNEALSIYRQEEKVMHLGGYMFPISSEGLPETFFFRESNCWGWGTWARAWLHFEKDARKLMHTFTRQQVREFNIDGYHNFWRTVKENYSGRRDTWAIFWYASIFLRRGLCLHPSVSLIQNIGHDGSGNNCPGTDIYAVDLKKAPIRYFEKEQRENPEALRRIQIYFRSIRPSFVQRLLNRMREITG
jgi:glycosyltransferase involved in cell wall biosynthesis